MRPCPPLIPQDLRSSSLAEDRSSTVASYREKNFSEGHSMLHSTPLLMSLIKIYPLRKNSASDANLILLLIVCLTWFCFGPGKEASYPLKPFRNMLMHRERMEKGFPIILTDIDGNGKFPAPNLPRL